LRPGSRMLASCIPTASPQDLRKRFAAIAEAE
jgi:hypothetical protein